MIAISEGPIPATQLAISIIVLLEGLGSIKPYVFNTLGNHKIQLNKNVRPKKISTN